MKILLTGGAGFSGSHLADAVIEQTDWDLVVLDKLTYAGKMENLPCSAPTRITFVRWDFSEPLDSWITHPCFQNVDFIVHLGAETHVKTSLDDPELFVSSNIVGTFNMLEAARRWKPKKFLYVSTDEVFGASLTPHKETDELNPSNPYSASKAAGEMLVRAYGTSFGVPWLITRTTNIFGARQHSEKFIPMTIEKIRMGRKVQIHTDAEGNSGSRQWIHASDQARAILFLLTNPAINDIYHIAGERKSNWDMACALVEPLGHELYAEKVNAFRMYPGHDLHYSLDDSKIRAMGWSPKLTLEEGLKLTV